MICVKTISWKRVFCCLGCEEFYLWCWKFSWENFNFKFKQLLMNHSCNENIFLKIALFIHLLLLLEFWPKIIYIYIKWILNLESWIFYQNNYQTNVFQLSRHPRSLIFFNFFYKFVCVTKPYLIIITLIFF